MAVLYVVSTPIGNLGDITLRALEVLRAVSLIACEDTRVTQKLLERYDIETPTVSCHAHSPGSDIRRITSRLEAGEDVAMVTDAGTPLVSDPGDTLVAAALQAGADVVPVPGASASLAAVVASGLPVQPLLQLGFLPRGAAPRREILSPLRSAPYTLVIYESPHRVQHTLEDLAKSLGDRPACVARELTKKFETFERGTLSSVGALLPSPIRGEVVIVVGPASDQVADGLDVAEAQIRALLQQGERPAEIARTVAVAHGLARKQAYKMVLAMKTDRNTSDDA